MAEIIGCLAVPHAPQLLMPPEKWQDLPTRVKNPGPEKPELAKELTLEAKQAKMKRCEEGMDFIRRKLDEWSPDIVILIGDDQRENILEDNTPPFVIHIGEEIEASANFFYLGESPIHQKRKYRAHPAAASFLLGSLMDAGFDPAWCKKPRLEIGLGHAFGRPLQSLMIDGKYAVLPIMVNTFYTPAPAPRRCFEFGKSLGSAIKNCKEIKKAVVVASGGLSHVRIDEKLDREFIAALEKFDAAYLAGIPSSVLVEGTSELRNWIITAAAVGTRATMVDYIPCYRTIQGIGCAMGFAYWNQ